MRALLIGLVALPLCACSTANTATFADFAKQIAQDPNCAHTDRVQGNLGGVTGNNLAVYLERSCPAKAATPTPPAATTP